MHTWPLLCLAAAAFAYFALFGWLWLRWSLCLWWLAYFVLCVFSGAAVDSLAAACTRLHIRFLLAAVDSHLLAGTRAAAAAGSSRILAAVGSHQDSLARAGSLRAGSRLVLGDSLRQAGAGSRQEAGTGLLALAGSLLAAGMGLVGVALAHRQVLDTALVPGMVLALVLALGAVLVPAQQPAAGTRGGRLGPQQACRRAASRACARRRGLCT